MTSIEGRFASARRGAGALLAVALLGLAAACARVPAPPAPAQPGPPGFPESYYREAAARGDLVYRLEPAHSRVTVRVHRAGPLARFGHEHVVASRWVGGYVRLARERSRADLYLPLVRLEVDPPELRAEAGLEPLAARDVEATRRNMLDAVLETERFPYAYLRLQPIAFDGDRVRLAAELTLHGRTRRLPVEARIAASEAALEAHGAFALVQSDFGIAPFSVLAGALRVADGVDIDFRLHATRAAGPRAAARAALAPAGRR